MFSDQKAHFISLFAKHKKTQDTTTTTFIS